MELLTEKWLPIQRRSGLYDWIAPYQITETDDPPVRLAASRPDFNGSLMQFLIGLLQTTTTINSNTAWDRAFERPPTPEQLQAQFASTAAAFELDGDGLRFMQDSTLTADEGEEKAIAALLIEAPGAQSIERNVDHFVKRGEAATMCPHCAAAALFTLQTNAPSGGAGHRTSLRGGGPLTTLVLYTPEPSATASRPSLWRNLWLNVCLRAAFLADSGDASLVQAPRSFPWLGSIEALQPGEETQPVHAHPAQMFWAMPRRIRLDFSNLRTGRCAICGRASEQLLSRYRTKNYGMNYKGAWRHPLSPYYQQKQGDPLLPLHPQPGGLGYRHWLAWVLGTSDGKKVVHPATVVSRFLSEVRDDHQRGQYRLWAFGFDMDNMKARCWYESTLPLYSLAASAESETGSARMLERLQEGAARMVSAAEQTLFYARSAIRGAWFGEAESKGDMSFIDAAFWSGTEGAFYRLLRQWVSLAQVDGEIIDAGQRLSEVWLAAMKKAAFELFGEHAESGQMAAVDPRRVAEAHRQLGKNLNGPKLYALLGLPTVDKAAGKRPAKTGRKKQDHEGLQS